MPLPESPPSTRAEHPPVAHRRSVGRVVGRAPRLLVESMLIVLSVLLGFAATEWRDRRAEQALAADALQNFRREIRQNLVVLDSVYPKHVALAARIDTALGTPRSGESAFQALVRAMPAGGISIPPLAEAAWETAASTGALRFLGYEQAARLSETYQVQRTTLVQTTLRLEDRLSAPEDFDPARRDAMLRVYQLLFRELSGQETYLTTVYRTTLRQLDSNAR